MSDYPSGMTLRPIERWPFEFTRNRRRSAFSATLGSTLGQLDAELRHLGSGRRAPSVLQIAMREQDFRRDGMPRAHAVPEHPGVILAIESKHGDLSYPCDTFTHWQDNLRAITLGLETCMWRSDFRGPRHHPTDAEDQAHLAECCRIRDWEDDVIARALGFTDEPIGQLELFDVAS